jgi:hypothetical protein
MVQKGRCSYPSGMKTLRWALSFFLVLAVVAQPLHAGATTGETGVLRVTLNSDDGQTLPTAHVYIYNRDKSRLAGTTETSRHATMHVKPGIYQVYAAGTRLTGDGIEHYSSPETTITITPYEDASAILRLTLVERPNYGLTDAMLKKMNIDPKIAQHLD